MRLTNSFRIDRPAAEVFDAFLDIERVATCIPGSRVLGRSGDDTYDGEVRVKVGPLRVSYTGRLSVLEADRDQLRLAMRAKGREQSGAGNADAHVVAQLADSDGGTVVDIDTDLSVRGKVAQFGQGVISDVSAGIMQTFAANMEEMLAGGRTTQATPGAPSAGETSEPAPSVSPDARATPEGAATDDGLDVWRLLVLPALRRHAGSMATIVCAGVAAYVGGRAGARRGARRR